MGLCQTHLICCNRLIWSVPMATKRQNLRKYIQKSIPQKLWWGIKLKLCRIVSTLVSTKLLFFIAVPRAPWLLCQLKSFHRLTMRKVRIEIYCYLIADIWQKFYRNVPWVVLYQTYEFCPNRWIGLVAMATKRQNLRKHIQKSTPQKLCGG